MSKLITTGNVTKVTRTTGKAFAQVTLTIPANKSGDFPLGEVNLTVEATQSSFDDVMPSRRPRGEIRG